ncbi:RNA polymerase, sigma-24 subunit, ECF subfamily [Frankia canadensis]|uniref:RNA polymerase, sigma-24 subunit, ECF subfamily n=1 Tax=Frankia canadensis TaxID=1836972 RepID=A0A2I2KZD8_9ACTN|nr:sigma-70 family RNA polymerase sigma factor [Frankia canadensis]SNQ51025.1 RNA polymerase, sigma-24 subunit, ECF subfamily [Frankia canadensis]SOU58315.1 RNA polymerase, sigma-24 subunit, ECF subfamily [Frankia canadensis]
MTDTALEVFEAQRPRLRAVAYRLLGSFSAADDAVQDAWLRLNRTDLDEVTNLPGWLTTVVARLCLDQLRARRARHEEPAGVHLPEPRVTPLGSADPEQEALLADAVGLALVAVLGTLSPAERLAFVLHDLFDVPFTEVATIVGRSPGAVTQLASRARRRLRALELGAGGEPRAAGDPPPASVAPASVGTSSADDEPGRGVDPVAQRRLVEAFRAAARDGDLDRLLAVLDPDVELRADTGPVASRRMRGAQAVGARVSTFAPMAPHGRVALVNGLPGIIVVPSGGPVVAVLGFTVRAGRIAAIEVHTDPDRLRHLDPNTSVW